MKSVKERICIHHPHSTGVLCQGCKACDACGWLIPIGGPNRCGSCRNPQKDDYDG